ncbi:MAG: GHMP kinase, partial [Nitrososphaerales archaeon]
MIISRTPFRISFFGGGTDFRDFYKVDFGAVLGTTIDKYMYVSVNKKFEGNVRVSYSKTEVVTESSQVKHELVREALLAMQLHKGIEVVTIADVPGAGTGLGSSSSTLVGLLNALSYYLHLPVEKEILAKLACDIEIGKLGSPIGKQDQYFAACGGLCYIRFNSDDSVYVERIKLSDSTLSELENNLLCFYMGVRQNATNILREQKENIPSKMEILTEMRNQAEVGKKVLAKGDLTEFGKMLQQGWLLKKKLANNITNDNIELYHEKALKNGALGGKISGAGGGGFLTLYCEPEYQKRVREALS